MENMSPAQRAGDMFSIKYRIWIYKLIMKECILIQISVRLMTSIVFVKSKFSSSLFILYHFEYLINYPCT